MATNASPQSGDVYLQFNGRDAYVEIPSLADYSVSTTGQLTISAWLKPDTLNCPSVKRNSDYIHWLGKGERSGAEGNQEWTFRMYNHYDPLDSPSRPNRISFYLFNPQGGLASAAMCKCRFTRGNGSTLSGWRTARVPTCTKMVNTFGAIHTAGRRRDRAKSTIRPPEPGSAARHRSAGRAGTPPAWNQGPRQLLRRRPDPRAALDQSADCYPDLGALFGWLSTTRRLGGGIPAEQQHGRHRSGLGPGKQWRNYQCHPSDAGLKPPKAESARLTRRKSNLAFGERNLHGSAIIEWRSKRDVRSKLPGARS